MRLKYITFGLLIMVISQCKPEAVQTSANTSINKDLEKYLEETFFFYELMRNQPSVLRDSIYLLVAQELQTKYGLDSTKLNQLTQTLDPSTPAYAQMLDSIKLRVKLLDIQ